MTHNLHQEFKVVFQPAGRTVYVLPGTLVLEAAIRAGITLNTPCGGTGTCGKCLVRKISGEVGSRDGKPSAGDSSLLACGNYIHSDAVIEIPESSTFEYAHKIVCDDHGSSVISDSAAPGQLGVAFDLGTTTVVGTLIELNTGKEIRVAGTLNRQTRIGDDVISRIQYSMQGAAALAKLRDAVTATLNVLLDELTSADEKQRISKITLAGNTTMQQLFCGMDCSSLGSTPFEPQFREGIKHTAAECGLKISQDAEVYIFPQIGGFVGGDTVAGLLAAEMHETRQPVLFVDLGTNGEIALAHNGRLTAASTAAGPAFEGARISRGMRAVTGAIEKVVFDGGDLAFNVIGNVPPRGICGTAVIDITAELLRHGLLDSYGCLASAEDLPAGTPQGLQRRLTEADGQPAFVIAGPEDGAAEAILITQRDIREIQLAVGAIRCGINILLKRAGIEPKDLHEVLLAGGFGYFIRRNNACRTGLLPAVASEKIRCIGNAASLGAKNVLLSNAARLMAERVRASTEHYELSSAESFSEMFTDAMIFPAGN